MRKKKMTQKRKKKVKMVKKGNKTMRANIAIQTSRAKMNKRKARRKTQMSEPCNKLVSKQKSLIHSKLPFLFILLDKTIAKFIRAMRLQIIQKKPRQRIMRSS